MTEKCISTAFLAMVCSGIGYTVYVVNRYISIEKKHEEEKRMLENEVYQAEAWSDIIS